MASAAPVRSINGPTQSCRQVPLRIISRPTLWQSAAPLRDVDGPILGDRQHLSEILMGQPYGVGSTSEKHQRANPELSASASENNQSANPMASAAPLKDVDGPILGRRQHLSEILMGQPYGVGSISQKHQWANPELSSSASENNQSANPMVSAAPLRDVDGPILGRRQHLSEILMGQPYGVGSTSQKHQWANPEL
jgi:hypothetical protein